MHAPYGRGAMPPTVGDPARLVVVAPATARASPVVRRSPGHDFPQRVLYWLTDGGRLRAGRGDDLALRAVLSRWREWTSLTVASNSSIAGITDRSVHQIHAGPEAGGGLHGSEVLGKIQALPSEYPRRVVPRGAFP